MVSLCVFCALLLMHCVQFSQRSVAWAQSTESSAPVNSSPSASTEDSRNAAEPPVSANGVTSGRSAAESTTAVPPAVNLQAEIPEFHLTQVLLEGQVEADRINLKATIEIMINRGEGWHRIPLRMAQAHVFSRQYSGPGEEAPDVAPRGVDEGLSWMIKGLGKHQLQLDAWIPLRRTLAGGQFKLSLPSLPAQFESRLKLRIPEANAVVRSGRNLTVLNVSRGQSATDVEASILGNRLEFSWQTPTQDGEAVSLAISRMQLKPSAEHLALLVKQTIELQQSPTDHIDIRIPEAFRLVQLVCPQCRSHEMLPDRPNWIRIVLTNDNLTHVELDWLLERELETEMPAEQRPVTLSGFQVAGALREEGLIRIDEFESAHLAVRPEDSELVHRVSVNQQVRGMGVGTPLTAFEYLAQPFQLTFDIERLEPYFSIDASHDMTFHEEAIDLILRCPIHIDRGAVSDFWIDWPQMTSDQWKLISSTGDRRMGRVSVETATPGRLHVVWPAAVTENAQVILGFRRELPSEMGATFPLGLPAVSASQVGETRLSVKSADPLEVQLLTAADEALLPVAEPVEDTPSGGSSRGTAPASNGILLEKSYRVPPDAKPLLARVILHERELSAETEVHVTEATDNGLLVEQLIQMQVRFGRVQTLDLTVPPALLQLMPPGAVPESVDVWFEGERLPLLFTAGTLRAMFRAPQTGKLELRVEYRFPIAAEPSVEQVRLPFLGLQDAKFSQVKCRIDAVERLQISADEPGWEAVQTSARGLLWLQTAPEEDEFSVPLVLGGRVTDASQQYVVERLNLRTRIERDGASETWAEFEFNAVPSRVVIQFPANASFKEEAFLVDGKPVPGAVTVRATGTSTEVTLTLNPAAKIDPRFALQYRLPAQHGVGLTQLHRMAFPQFHKSVWVDETIWEVALPYGQHLFTSPELVPQFGWVRHFFAWSRRPTESYRQEHLRANATLVPEQFRFPDGDYYAFRSFGPVEQVEFRSMSRSLIVLTGAGLALLLGFIFWKFPATRNIFTLVVLLFLFSVASLWYLEPMRLLMQPALFGLSLALLATVIDSLTGSRTSEPTGGGSELMHGPGVPEHSSSMNVATRIYRPLPSGKSDQVSS